MPLVAVGKRVKYAAWYLQQKREQRGSGWSDEERRRFKLWEANDEAFRGTVVSHEPDATGRPSYVLSFKYPTGESGIMHTLPDKWTEAEEEV